MCSRRCLLLTSPGAARGLAVQGFSSWLAKSPLLRVPFCLPHWELQAHSGRDDLAGGSCPKLWGLGPCRPLPLRAGRALLLSPGCFPRGSSGGAELFSQPCLDQSEGSRYLRSNAGLEAVPAAGWGCPVLLLWS